MVISLNYLLKINKKILFVLIIITILLITLTLVSQSILFNISQTENYTYLSNSNYDISKPEFSINNKKNSISITANKGNFINKNEIILEDNVEFTSKNFKISTSNVYFNQKNQTAKSLVNSLFESNKTLIKSEGFDITENGNIIKFNGKTKLIILE